MDEVRSLLQGKHDMIIHVDVACDTSERQARVGVVIRDSRGGLIATLHSLLVSNVNTLCAEALAILEGLRLADRMNFRRAKIFSDSLSLVMMLRKETTVCINVASIIWDIEGMMKCFQSVVVEYVSQNYNVLTHTLARQSLWDGSILWLSSFPSWLFEVACNELHLFVTLGEIFVLNEIAFGYKKKKKKSLVHVKVMR